MKPEFLYKIIDTSILDVPDLPPFVVFTYQIKTRTSGYCIVVDEMKDEAQKIPTRDIGENYFPTVSEALEAFSAKLNAQLARHAKAIDNAQYRYSSTQRRLELFTQFKGEYLEAHS